MNRNLPLLAWMVAILLSLSAFLNGFFVFQQVMLFKEIENLNEKISEDPQLTAGIQNIIVDLIKYGQKQPAIFSVLKKYGITPTPSPPPPSSSK